MDHTGLLVCALYIHTKCLLIISQLAHSDIRPTTLVTDPVTPSRTLYSCLLCYRAILKIALQCKLSLKQGNSISVSMVQCDPGWSVPLTDGTGIQCEPVLSFPSLTVLAFLFVYFCCWVQKCASPTFINSDFFIWSTHTNVKSKS